MVLTIITVAVGYVHLAIPLAVTVALIIATIKASLVATFFMHLKGEKKVIYYSLMLAATFFVFLMLIPSLAHLGSIGNEQMRTFDHVPEGVSPPVH